MVLVGAQESDTPVHWRVCADSAQTSLYLADGGALTTSVPADGSVAFQAAAGGPLVWLVGTWSSAPLGAPVSITSAINFTIWAKASGGAQLRTRFQVYIGVNDQRGDTAYTTGNDRLSSTPSEFKGTATSPNLKLQASDTLGFWVYASERGMGGELLFGAQTPSRLEMALQPVTLNLTVSTRQGGLDFSGNVTDIWGTNDITGLTVAVFGPFASEDDSLCGLELFENRTRLVKSADMQSSDPVTTEEASSGELGFSYRWKSIPSGLKEGTYMAAAMVETLSNITIDSTVWVKLGPGNAGFQLGNTALAGGAAVLAAVAAVSVFYLYRTHRGPFATPAKR